MREIKYRAWDESDEQFISGFVVTENGDVYVNDDPEMRLVDAILMQYTGLKDKNGFEIYEGDIVKHDDFSVGFVVSDQPKRNSIIKWDKNNGRYYAEGMVITGGYIRNGKVVGNIYENLELLEDSE